MKLLKTRHGLKFLILVLCLSFLPTSVCAVTDTELKTQDTDVDRLSDDQEMSIYKTNPLNPDTDGDGYTDGDEVIHNYDPNNTGVKLEKEIYINLKTQILTYGLGPYKIAEIKISSGTKRFPTPKGTFGILKKPPLVRYKGPGYDYKNTRWNMLFKYQKAGNLYIHGAYWHNKFGQRMSHGCVNVSYKDMEPLYNWTDLGTKVYIQ